MIDLWYFLFVKIVHFYTYKIAKKNNVFLEFVFPKKKAMYQNNNSNFFVL